MYQAFIRQPPIVAVTTQHKPSVYLALPTAAQHAVDRSSLLSPGSQHTLTVTHTAVHTQTAAMASPRGIMSVVMVALLAAAVSAQTCESSEFDSFLAMRSS